MRILLLFDNEVKLNWVGVINSIKDLRSEMRQVTGFIARRGKGICIRSFSGPPCLMELNNFNGIKFDSSEREEKSEKKKKRKVKVGIKKRRELTQE